MPLEQAEQEAKREIFSKTSDLFPEEKQAA
jgi:hypothetical protein